MRLSPSDEDYSWLYGLVKYFTVAVDHLRFQHQSKLSEKNYFGHIVLLSVFSLFSCRTSKNILTTQNLKMPSQIIQTFDFFLSLTVSIWKNSQLRWCIFLYLRNPCQIKLIFDSGKPAVQIRHLLVTDVSNCFKNVSKSFMIGQNGIGEVDLRKRSSLPMKEHQNC